MTRIALIGPGAIGATIAAWLAQDPQFDVTLCARTPLERLEIETPTGPIAATPRVLTDPAQAEPVDWVLIATKAYDAEGAARWLKHLRTTTTPVAVLQNGVEHVERFAPYVDRAHIVPAVVDIPAERSGPGKVLQRRKGTIVVPEGGRGNAFAALFAQTPIAVSTTPDFKTVAWKKLCLNCGGVMSALTLKPAGVSRRPDVAAVIHGLVAECAAVGRAEGADLPEDQADLVVGYYQSVPPESANSIYADRLAGRPTEIDARNGVIVRLGEKHGIATPLNRMAVAIIEAER